MGTKLPPGVILDCGSGSCKAGIAGEEEPRVNVSTVVGRNEKQQNELERKKHYIGKEAQNLRDLLSLSYPIQRGKIINFDDMEKIYHNILYEELQIDTTEYAIIHTETALLSSEERMRIIECIIETLQPLGFYLVPKATSTMYASGRTTASVFQSGHSVSTCTPIYEGYCLPNLTCRDKVVAGEEITNLLAKLLAEKDPSLAGLDYDIVNDIKEKVCRVALDYEAEVKKDTTVKYTLPDGKEIEIGNERFTCTEALFQSNGDKQCLAKTIYNCIVGDHEFRDYCGNMLIGGGNTLLPGLAERLQAEMQKLIPSTMRSKVIAPPGRGFSSFVGASILGSLSSFNQMLISLEDYEEFGPRLVNTRCF